MGQSPNPLVRILPYTTPLLNLIGVSFRINALRPGSKILTHRLISALGDMITLLAIVYVASKATQVGGVEKALITGALTILLAVIVPRFVLEPALAKYCAVCTEAGRFGTGFTVLACLVVVNYILESTVLMPNH